MDEDEVNLTRVRAIPIATIVCETGCTESAHLYPAIAIVELVKVASMIAMVGARIDSKERYKGFSMFLKFGFVLFYTNERKSRYH